MPTIKISSAMLGALTSNNCVMKVNGAEVTLDFVIPIGSQVTIEIVGNFIFEAPPAWGYSNLDGMVTSKPFTLVNNKLTSIIQPNFNDATQTSMNRATISIDTIPAGIDVSGNNRLYSINNEQLQTINSERFVNISGTPFDYGQFIIGLIELPFKLPDDSITNEDLIQLGTLETSVSAPSITTDKVTFDL